jgi:histidyl-tRNA synthetase
MGVERLLALIEAEGAVVPAHVPDLYVVHQGAAAEIFAWQVGETLRSQGLDVVMHCGGGSFKTQLRKADGSGARYALVIGDDEAAARRVSLKPLRESAEQALVDVAEVAGRVGRKVQ